MKANLQKTLPFGGRGGFLSSSYAQFLVLLNGLVLTFTIFASIHIFITQTLDEGFAITTGETRAHLEERFSELEKTIQAAASVVSFAGKITSGDIRAIFSNTLGGNDSFEQIYWLQPGAQGDFTAHRIGPQRPVSSAFQKLRSADIHRYVALAVSSRKEEGGARGIFLLDGRDLNAPSLEGGDYILILGKKIVRDDGTIHIVYGLTSVRTLLAPAFLGYRTSLQELGVVIGNASEGQYQYLRNPDQKESRYSSLRDGFSLSLGDQQIGFTMRVDLSEREHFLKMIPILVGLFGILITIVGTLYVRSNQRQSERLATMNMELGRKNTDLNNEIQEREKLNLALRRRERENRAVIDAVSDIIFETATDGKIVFLNETWHKITGFRQEQSIGRQLFDLLHMQDQAEQRESFAQLVKGKKQGYRAFTRLRTSNGNFRAVELAVSMLRQDENRDLRVVGTITDVEERRRAERALSEAEKKYRAIVENSASGIYQVTPEGQYLSANPAMARILGYDSADIMLSEVQNATSEIYCSGRERERQLRETIRSGSINTECQVRRRDGSIIWVQENLRAVKDEDDQLLFFEGSMEDVTQRKNTEIALREAMMQSDLASRAKSEFLANMSHELRTPLNAIIGFSDIIKTEAFGKVGSPEYIDYARDINESGKHLLDIINDILDVSRIEAGDRQLNEGIVELDKIVSSCVDLLSPKIESGNIILTNNVGAKTPRVIGETHAIKQMVVNLLSNAVKFTPAGGRVSVEAAIDDYGQLLLSITDTGIGLTDEEIEKALSPFGQVNSAHNRHGSGTGLGLTLVQSLIGLHGGALELFSQKGIGTTATLIFPHKRVAQSGVRTPETV